MSDATRIQSTLRDIVMDGVGTRTVGAENKTMWYVTTAGGPEITTFNAPLGNAARTLWEQGLAADMQVTIQQKGKYTNYYLDKIQAAASGKTTTPIQQAAKKAQQAAESRPEMTFEEFGAHANKERQSIHRQTAAKVAAELASESDGAQVFWQNCRDLVTFFESGATPWDSDKATTVPEPESFDTPPPPGDDDIPF